MWRIIWVGVGVWKGLKGLKGLKSLKSLKGLKGLTGLKTRRVHEALIFRHFNYSFIQMFVYSIAHLVL